MAKKSKDFFDTTSPQPDKPKQTGGWGESVAAQFLISQGCAIREVNWRGHNFELDLIAQKGTRVIFVEVKTRKEGTGDPVDAVDRKKRQNMIRAADYYLKYLNLKLDYQFDIISIVGSELDYKITHIADAFFPTPRSGTLFKH